MQYKGKLVQQGSGLYSVSESGVFLTDLVKYSSLIQWEEFIRLGSDVEDVVIEERLKQQRADQCAGVVFSVSYPA